MPATNDPAERKDRHLAYAQRVQALTMRLVEATATRAEQGLAEQPQTPTAEDAPRAPDHILAFVRLTRALTQTITLESRVASDDVAHPTRSVRAPAPPARPKRSDPRRALLQQAFHKATQSHPDRAQRRREINASIDHHLEADPAQTLPAAEILQAVSAEIDLPLNPAHLSDEILGIPPRPSPYRQSG